jgi:hypothetical protein
LLQNTTSNEPNNPNGAALILLNLQYDAGVCRSVRLAGISQ